MFVDGGTARSLFCSVLSNDFHPINPLTLWRGEHQKSAPKCSVECDVHFVSFCIMLLDLEKLT